MEIDSVVYKSRHISVLSSEDGLALNIDGKKIAVRKTSANEGYSTPLVPYKTFSNLIDLGKAVIRQRSWRNISHKK